MITTELCSLDTRPNDSSLALHTITRETRCLGMLNANAASRRPPTRSFSRRHIVLVLSVLCFFTYLQLSKWAQQPRTREEGTASRRVAAPLYITQLATAAAAPSRHVPAAAPTPPPPLQHDTKTDGVITEIRLYDADPSRQPRRSHVGVFLNTVAHFETALAVVSYLATDQQDALGLGVDVTLWGMAPLSQVGVGTISDYRGRLAYLRAHPNSHLRVVPHGSPPPNASTFDAIIVVTHWEHELTPKGILGAADPTYARFLALAPPRRVVFLSHRASPAMIAMEGRLSGTDTARVLAVAPQVRAVFSATEDEPPALFLPGRLLEGPMQPPTSVAPPPKPRVFVLQGRINAGSRNLAAVQSLLRNPRFVALAGAGTVQLRIVGSGASDRVISALNSTGVAFVMEADEASFHAAVRTSHFMLLALLPGTQPEYFVGGSTGNRMTSSMALSFAYALPVVLHAQLLPLYGAVPPSAAFSFGSATGSGDGGRGFEDAFFAAAELPWEGYTRAREAYVLAVRDLDARNVAVLSDALFNWERDRG